MDIVNKSFRILWFFILLASPISSIYGDAAIGGKVKNAASGSPMPAVKVILLDSSANQIAKAITDAKGSYLFSNVPSNQYMIQINSPSDYVVVNDNPVLVTVESENLDVNFSLSVPGIIMGRVIDNVTNLPIANADVEILRGSSLIAVVKTDENGVYKVPRIVSRPHIVRVRAPYYQTGLQLAVVAEGQTFALDFNIQPLFGRMVGQVIHSFTGEPIQEASVSLIQEKGPVASASTDSNGGFNLNGAGNYKLLVEAPRFYLSEQEVQIVPGQTLAISVELLCMPPPPPAHITGKVKTKIFAHQETRINQITWEASPDPLVSSYRIYRNKKCIAEIPADKTLIYNDSWRFKKATTYQLTAVNVYGQESEPSSKTVRK